MVDHLDPVDVVFGKDGVFATEFKSYEPREGQIDAARVCFDAMRKGRIALIEAPCGTGKSFAYGSMAAYFAAQGKRIAIVTANIALSEQLVHKDLPFLQRVLPWDFTFAMLKGRSNYACRERRDALAAQRMQLSLHQQADLDVLLEWFDKTETGDKSELSFVPADNLWSRASVGTDHCKGKSCSFRGTCFAERAKDDAWDNANIIVTNYHLYFAHLSVLASTGRPLVLPNFDIVIFDEAHEAPDVARSFFGFDVTEGQVRSVLNYLDDADIMRPLAEASSELFERIERWARELPYEGTVPPEQIRITQRDFVDTTRMFSAMKAALDGIKRRAAEIHGIGKEDTKKRSDLEVANRLIRKLWDRLGQVVHTQSPEMVYWIELPKSDKKNSRLKISAQQIVPGPVIAPWLFEAQFHDDPNDKLGPVKTTPDSVILTSATLMTNGNFRFVRNELGVPATDRVVELAVESPFDFESQSMFIVPEEMRVDPDQPEFQGLLTDITRSTIEICKGRTLAIFTSYKHLHGVYDGIVGKVPYRVLKQGDAPRMSLTQDFKNDVGSVLLGTSSFWTGIDVPGESLSALVVSKTPFESPDTPLLNAIQELTGDSFGRYSVPKAIMRLRQGVGRLIRSKTDRGVIVFCDRRVLASRWGKSFLRSLPRMKRGKNMADVKSFMQQLDNR